MNKTIKLNDPEPPPLAPDSIYYELHTRLLSAYQQWAQDNLSKKAYLVEIEKIKYKIGEAANSMLEALKHDFTIQGERNKTDDSV